MGKGKKTLKQKKISELRRLKESHGNTPIQTVAQEVSPQPVTNTFSYSFSQQVKKSATQTYSLQHDLRKTLFVSVIILASLLLLSLLLQTRTFVLPLVSLRY